MPFKEEEDEEDDSEGEHPPGGYVQVWRGKEEERGVSGAKTRAKKKRKREHRVTTSKFQARY